MMLYPSIYTLSVSELSSAMESYLEFIPKEKRTLFIRCYTTSLKKYQSIFNSRIHFHSEVFQPIAYVRIYLELGLKDEAIWLLYLMQLIGHHPKSHWRTLEVIYFNGEKEPYFTWDFAQHCTSIKTYLSNFYDSKSSLHLGLHYKNPILNAATIQDIHQRIAYFITLVQEYGSICNLVDALSSMTLPIKEQFLFTRFEEVLVHLELTKGRTIHFHLNGQLMIKKSIRNLYDDSKKSEIKVLTEFYHDLVQLVSYPLGCLVLLDALLNYHAQHLFHPYQRNF